jgi:hypothetical protein
MANLGKKNYVMVESLGTLVSRLHNSSFER